MRLFKNGNQYCERENLLRGIRELRALVTYQGPHGYYILTDESDNNLITEADLDNIVTEKENVNLKEDSILNIKYYCKADFIKTICKMVEIKTTQDISLNNEISVKIGAKNPSDGEYYYVNLGKYYVFSSEYDADTNSYLIVAYDKMYESMIKYDGDIPNLTFPCTHREFLEKIFDKFGWNYTSSASRDSEFNSVVCDSDDAVISKDIYSGLDMTYRDVINDLAVTYGALYFNEDNILTVKMYDSSYIPINYEDIKKESLKITEPYEWEYAGGVTRVTLTNSEGMTYTIVTSPLYPYSGDDYDMGNNLFVQETMNVTADFNKVQDDISFLLIGKDFPDKAEIPTIGILTLEPLDSVIVEDPEGYTVKTIQIFENTITLNRGLNETLISEVVEEIPKNFVTSTPETSDIKNAIINIDKANAEIVLKVDSNGNLAKVALNGNADSGTSVAINADSIHLEGYTTINNGFAVDNSGNMQATSGEIGGWIIDSESMYSDYGNNRVYIQSFLQTYGLDTWIFSVQENTGGGYTDRFRVDGRGDLYANNIACGTCTLNSSSEVRVSFGKTFTNTPRVVITPRTSASGVIAPKIRTVTSTYFEAIIGGSGFSSIDCDWIAIG